MSLPTWIVSRVDLIDNATMSTSDGIILDDERRMSGLPIGWRVFFTTVAALSLSTLLGVARAIKRAKDVPKGILRAPGLRSLRIGRDSVE